MHPVAHPGGGGGLPPVAGVGVYGMVYVLCRRRDAFLGGAPPPHATVLLANKVLHPHSPQRPYRRNLAQQAWCISKKNGLQEFIAVVSYTFGFGPAGFLALG